MTLAGGVKRLTAGDDAKSRRVLTWPLLQEARKLFFPDQRIIAYDWGNDPAAEWALDLSYERSEACCDVVAKGSSSVLGCDDAARLGGPWRGGISIRRIVKFAQGTRAAGRSLGHSIGP